MKIRSVISSLLFAAAFAAPALRADDFLPIPANASPAPAPEKKEDKTDLEKQMSKISHSMRALKKLINNPSQNASSLELVATIHGAAVASLKLTPAKAEDYEGAEKDKFIAAYQSGMKEFIEAVDKLDDALKANDNAEASKDFKQLFSIEKQDHKQFRRPEKD